jgi:hypothetical protein
MVTIISKYFPLFALIFSAVPALIKPQWYKSVPGIDQESEIYYKRAYWGSLIYMAIIWTPMIIGIFIGNVPTMLHFFVRGIGNLYINAYWIILTVLSVAGIIWTFFFNGAQFIIDYYLPLQSSLLSRSKTLSISPGVIKLISIFSLVVIIVVWFFILPDDVGVLNNLLLEAP